LFPYGIGIGVLSFHGKAHELAYSVVSGNYFSTLGVKPAAGRLLAPGDEQAAVLGHTYWRKKFGGDRGVVGKQGLQVHRPLG
jgi:hypothetical protein